MIFDLDPQAAAILGAANSEQYKKLTDWLDVQGWTTAQIQGNLVATMASKIVTSVENFKQFDNLGRSTSRAMASMGLAMLIEEGKFKPPETEH